MTKRCLVVLLVLSFLLLCSCSSNSQRSAHDDVTNQPISAKITEQPSRSLSSEKQYVLNTNTKKFHKPSCSSVKQMKDSNKKIVVMSRDAIIELGYSPCKRCNP